MLPLLVRKQGQCSHKVRPLVSVIRGRWVRWTLVSARIPAIGSSVRARSARWWWTMPCRAMCLGIPGATWPACSAMSRFCLLSPVTQDAHGCWPEEHVQKDMDLMEDLSLFLARYVNRWNSTLERLLLRARQLQRSGAISIPLNCSSNPLWIQFLERFGLPVLKAFSMESFNSIACLLHWWVLLALGACLPGKLKYQVLGAREGKPGVKQASTLGQSRGKARPHLAVSLTVKSVQEHSRGR